MFYNFTIFFFFRFQAFLLSDSNSENRWSLPTATGNRLELLFVFCMFLIAFLFCFRKRIKTSEDDSRKVVNYLNSEYHGCLKQQKLFWLRAQRCQMSRWMSTIIWTRLWTILRNMRWVFYQFYLCIVLWLQCVKSKNLLLKDQCTNNIVKMNGKIDKGK